MGSIYQAPQHVQICWSATGNAGQPLSVMLAKDDDRHQIEKTIRRYSNQRQSLDAIVARRPFRLI
jgi:hypothetical protein